jgi:malto-oligosyltrehalose synthase/4-alpha-glucanotransferase
MYNPIATYRIQLHHKFKFDDLERCIPYLRSLGISTLYASPIFESTPGSLHGYDSINPHKINPEISTLEQFQKLSLQFEKKRIGWLQDIVPNHMAFHPGNLWLTDLLEKGAKSQYASFFDNSLNNEFFREKMIVPFLGASLEEAIHKGDLKITTKNKKFVLSYFDAHFPLQIKSYLKILSHLDQVPEPIKELIIQHVAHKDDSESRADIKFLKNFNFLLDQENTGAYVEKCVDEINNHHPALKEIAEDQMYRLCSWKEADHGMNYRRFFTVNGLICLNIQNEEVFNEYHKVIQHLIEKDIIKGLRVDHIDGLYNPSQYLKKLRKTIGKEPYIVVEKILESGEALPENWPIQGSTGYDFLSLINNLFTNKDHEKEFTDFYTSLTEDSTPVIQQLHDKKSYILYKHMGGELENLYQFLLHSDLIESNENENTNHAHLKSAIAEFLLYCPVYRYYGNDMPLEEVEEKAVRFIFDTIKKNRSELAESTQLLENVLLVRPKHKDEAYRDRALQFYQRCMQFTGPLMAKGMEDTLMYTYNRFIGHNEVGDSPEAFGITIQKFHELMQLRQQKWPLSMNASSTHDTKRGEDVRARLNVLSDLPEEWFAKVRQWQDMNADLKRNGVPTPNDEYFIYQNLVGAMPFAGQPQDNIQARFPAYLTKALREAKTNSNYNEPNETYEDGTVNFAKKLLDPSNPFLKSLLSFQERIGTFAVVNSLSQLVLKFSCPGIPDVYQGTELWDLSLVDPDNRREVDYNLRNQYLQELLSWDGSAIDLLSNLWKNRYSAKIKLWLTHLLFTERRNHPEIFLRGKYIPLEVEGSYKEFIFAFARNYQSSWRIIIVPLQIAKLIKDPAKDLPEFDWMDTRILIPEKAPQNWTNTFTKETGIHNGTIQINQLFTTIPLAHLKLQSPSQRGSGILMHVTSLPSSFGIGDLGHEAKRFARFLADTGQSYWQLLPLNPTESDQSHSPYSSVSGLAGNTLLISPDLLVEDGLIEASELKPYMLPTTDHVLFDEAEKSKNAIFERAWQNFKMGEFKELKAAFKAFCKKEESWLNYFAIYIVIKGLNADKPWHQWNNTSLRDACPEALQQITIDQAHGIEKTKWLQFIFFRQWKKLRSYCNARDIQLIGDMPFYVSYDSVDVWANKELFALDADGKMTGIAGVPPDDFSEDGQYWGMPLFNWKKIKEQKYTWWIERFKKNMELFDTVRLDHFRAFNDYWYIPATAKTAKEGHWEPGPGADLFHAAHKALGTLSFIAEDLGEVNEGVYALRDQFNFPGMKVLQFAFTEEVPWADFAPHNYKENFIVYTGTHDNNTSHGWARMEGRESLKILEAYTGRMLKEEEVAEVLIRLALASVAKTAIIPAQDLLNLNETSRMNTPATTQKNWAWRLLPEQLTHEIENRLKELTVLYNRNK